MNKNDYKIVNFDRATFNQGKNAQYQMGIDDSGIAHTLINKGAGGVLCYDGQSCIAYADRASCLQAGRMDDHHIGVVVYEKNI